MPYQLFWLWVIIANAAGLNLMYKDKVGAENGGRRVKERTLFIVAALFGAVAVYASMYALRHKLRKYYFKYGMVVFLIENIVAGLAVLFLIWLLY